jgi:serine/threonine protein phosphatase PrpC
MVILLITVNIIAMEDAHTTLLNLGDTNLSFFGVYDGHGGNEESCKIKHRERLAKHIANYRFFYSSLYWSNIIQKSIGKQILRDKGICKGHDRCLFIIRQKFN